MEKELIDICKAISDYTGIKVDDIKGKSRLKEHAIARQLLFYFGLREIPQQVISRFVNRDHSSIRRGSLKIAGFIEINDYYTCKAVYDINKLIVSNPCDY